MEYSNVASASFGLDGMALSNGIQSPEFDPSRSFSAAPLPSMPTPFAPQTALSAALSIGRTADLSVRAEESSTLSNRLPRRSNGIPRAKKKKGGSKTIFRGSQTRLIGTPRKDILDTSRGKGENTLKGLGGDDVLRAKAQDTLLGGNGDDRLTVLPQGRQNRLRGGAGGDRLTVWNRDRAFGNSGDDILTAWGAKGRNRLNGGSGNDQLVGYANDVLIGGAGADEFRLTQGALPQRPSRIKDFKPGTDLLSVPGLTSAQQQQVNVVQAGRDTLVRVEEVAIARLKNITATALDNESFLDLSPLAVRTPSPSSPDIQPPLNPPPAPSPRPLRDPSLHPFASTSIWNTPIGANASYIPAQIRPTSYLSADIDHFYGLTQADPNRDVFRLGTWRNRTRGREDLGFDLPISDGLILPDSSPIDTPNNSSAFLLPDGDTIVQLNATTRDRPGSRVYGAPFPNASLTGEGIEGGHGGSGLSSIGGTIRIGELTGEGPIQHVLKVNLWAEEFLAYRPGAQGGLGYRWPAVRADSYANAETYGGEIPELLMGSLLAIPPTVTANSLGLQTQPARKLFQALQDYGAYVADDTAFDTHAFTMESGTLQEFEQHYGYEFEGRQGPFFDDIMTLFSALHVVNNNKADRIGGGGAPRQLLAPAIDPNAIPKLQALLNDPTVQDTFEADFNNDGTTDLLWRNLVSGANQIWLRNESGSRIIGGGNILPLSDRNWQIHSTPDINRDGRADILWVNRTTGKTQQWFLNDLYPWVDPRTNVYRYRWQDNATALPTIIFPAD